MVRRISLLFLTFFSLQLSFLHAQCTVPVGSDTSLCNPASVILSVNGNTGFYNWYDSPNGPSYLNNGSTFTSPLVNLRDTFYVSEYDTGATNLSLLFDGTNDYTPIQDYNYNSTGIPEVTIEVWINTGNSGDQVIASYDRNEYWRLEINGSGGGPGQIGFDILTNGGQLDFGSISRVDDGLWHHVAAVYDNGTVSIYIDGVLDASTTSGTTFGTGTTRFGFLSNGSEADVFDGTTGPNNYFDGEIGNFRIWSVARTQAEILQFMNRCLDGPQAGLEVAYTMNGSGSDDVIIDYSGNQRNAELRNFPLPGAWLSTGPSLNRCFACESARDEVIVEVIPTTTNVLGMDTCIAGDSLLLDPGPAYFDYLWQDNSTNQTFTAYSSGTYSVILDTINGCEVGDTISVVINPKPVGIDTSFCGQNNYQLRATGSNGLYRWYDDYNATTAIDTGRLDFFLSATDTFYVSSFDTTNKNNALDFDPVASNYASILGYSYAGTSYTELTIQCWIRTTNGNDQIIASFDRSEYWRLEVNGDGGSLGTVGFSVATDNGIFDFGGSIRVDDGNWHHVAAVFDNGTFSIYVDGVLDNTTTQGSTFGTGATRFGFLGTGSESDTEDGTTGPDDYFDGSIADFGVWSRAFSLAEIVNSLNNCKVAGESGLEVYYPFSDGGGTLITDRSGNNRNAILKNTFAANAWNNGGPIIEGCASECESERDTVIALLNITPRPDLGPDICASSATIIDAGPNYTSYLWNTAETTQTIVTNDGNEGLFYVTVDSAGTPCSGSDTIFSNIILMPQATDSSNCGPGTVELQVSGGSTFKWFDKNGNTVGTGSTYIPSLTASDTFTVASIECDTLRDGLSFGGVNQYVALDMFYNTSGQISELTLEAWVRTTATGGDNDNWAIVDFDRSDYYNFYVLGDGRVGFSTTSSANNIDDFYSNPAVLVNDGTWHHIAAVYDGTDKLIYIDGNLVSTRTNPHNGLNLGVGTSRYGIIGDGSEASTFNGGRNNLYYDGDVAELRIWHSVRTADQIMANMNQCLSGTESGLAAYYKTNDGVGSSTLTDFSGNNRNGTLFNMNLSTDWIITNNDIFCDCCESDVDTAIATIYDAIDSNRFTVACPSIDSSAVVLNVFGGSGQFDFRELSGEFPYSNNFVAGQSKRSLLNGGTYQIEIQDDNGCLDTTSNITINTSPSAIASSNSTGSCRIIDQNKFSFIVNGSNEVIVGVRSPSDDLGEVTASTFIQPNAQIYFGEAHLNRSLLINSDSTISSSVDLRIPLFTAELNDLIDSAIATTEIDDDLLSIGELGVTKYNGPTEDGVYDPSDATSLVFISQNSSGSQFGAEYFEITTSSFSEFWPHSSFSNFPLPIVLKSFNVSLTENKDVLIEWSTYSEINNDYFTIEKTKDGVHWFEVARINGNGNTNQVHRYSSIDEDPYSGKSYYRLKQTDFDGRFDHFTPLSITIQISQSEFVVYPNPSNGRISIEISSGFDNDEIMIRIFSLDGNLLYSKSVTQEATEASRKFQIDVSEEIPSGVYIIQLRSEQENQSKKLIINN